MVARPARRPLPQLAIFLATWLAAGACAGSPARPSTSGGLAPPSAQGDLPIDMAALLSRLPAPGGEELEAFGQMVDQSLIDHTRRAGGVADALGAEADATFQQADTSREQTLVNLTEEEIGALPWGADLASVGGLPEPPPALAVPLLAASFLVQMSSDGVAGHALDFFENVPNNEFPVAKTGGEYGEGAAHGSFTKTTTLAGPRLIVEGTMTVRIDLGTPPGGALVEKYTGRLEVAVCPDPAGAVPLTLEIGVASGLQGSPAASGSGELKLSATAKGTVDDEANLATVEVATNTSGRATVTATGEQTKGAYAEIGLDVSYAPSGSDAFGTMTGFGSRVIHQSSRVTDADLVDLATTSMLADVFVIRDAFEEAQELWRNGYCVEIQVSDPPNAYKAGVDVKSTHPIAAEVRHRREGGDVDATIEASMTSGATSVAPSGQRLPSPATFTYTAPDKVREAGTVLLRTVSRRGIAEKHVSFNTFLSYRLRLTYTYSATLVVLAGNTTSGRGTDVFEGTLQPKDSEQPSAAIEAYEGRFTTSSNGTSDQQLADIHCSQAWTGTQEMYVLARPFAGSAKPSLDVTFRAVSSPSYSRHESGGGTFCVVDDPVASDGQAILPFGNSIIGEGIPLLIEGPPPPGETATQQIDVSGDLTGMHVVGGWLVEWLPPEQ